MSVELEQQMPAHQADGSGRGSERKADRRRSRGKNPGWPTPIRWVLRVAVLLVVLGLWWLWGQTQIGGRALGTPDAVLAELRQWPTNPVRVNDAVQTLKAASIGFAYGVSLGFSIAFAARFVPYVAQFLAPFIAALNALPKVALGSVFILAFGLGINSKIAFVVSIVFFVIFFPIYEGLGSVPQDLVRHARVIGVGRFAMLRTVYLPASLLWMTTGLRLAATYSILGAAAGEYLGAQAGIGHVIRQAMFYGDGVSMMAGVAVLSTSALLLDRLLVFSERRFSAWRLF